ncbi:hypothetical protein [Rhizobacter sp. Root1221]|uniref:hypothetical protein n=1 Tax=Rhizobacter sp. Root1221 TaxID=1736433 RepID=UPI0012FB6AB3|nr:hypothetical protein [Rhizobacter sp. Root1221]
MLITQRKSRLESRQSPTVIEALAVRVRAPASVPSGVADRRPRRGGEWSNLGPPTPDAPNRGRSQQPNQAVERAPATKAGTKGVVAVGGTGRQGRCSKALMRVMVRQPDPLVADVLEYAVRRQSSSSGA